LIDRLRQRGHRVAVECRADGGLSLKVGLNTFWSRTFTLPADATALREFVRLATGEGTP
jgi:hypothetical protein